MYKLQAGCFVIMLFLNSVYLSTRRRRTREHKIYVAMLLATLIYLVVDVASIYTVNHMNTVPIWLNDISNKLFLSSILVVLYIVFIYIIELIDQDRPIFNTKYKWIKWPPLVPILLIFLLPISYVQTPQGNYASNHACDITYLTCTYYFIMSLVLLIRYHADVNVKKRNIIALALATEIVVCVIQYLYPSLLLTSLGITLLCLAFFLTVENPDVHLVECLKEEKLKAEKANQTKSNFIASVSHEIRTPINGVIGMNEMILRESKEENIREYAVNIKSAAQTLLSIINDILDLSKMESGKMEIKSVEYELGSLINDVYHMITDKAKAKGLTLQIQVDKNLPAVLYGDDVRIRQILMNLLSNAVKYTKTGTITLKVDGRMDAKAVALSFSVSDTGIGIKKENMSKLFEAFERLDEIKNRNIEGTGLGLAITKQLLELMGSRLMVQSVYGEGSTFSFCLEQRIVDRRELGDFDAIINKKSRENYVYQASLYAPKSKILLVDDNEINRKVFVALLKETGVQITEGDCGQACLNAVRKEHFDIIFLDHMMPDMDGMETFRKFKELGRENLCARTPVIIFTANASTGAKEIYLREGFNGFLSKPVVPAKLERILRKWLPQELMESRTADAENVKAGDMFDATVNENSEEIKLPYIDGIDWEYAKRHFPDEKLLMTLAGDFGKSVDTESRQVAELCQGIDTEEGLKNYKTKVHALKSSAAMIGALPLSGMAKILEYAAAEQRLDKIRTITPVFLEEMGVYKERLKVLLPKNDNKEKLTDAAQIMALLEMLRMPLAEVNFDEADVVMEQINQYTYEDEIQVLMDEIGQLVHNLQTEEAERKIQSVYQYFANV